MGKIIADFHVHTDASYDSKRNPEETVIEARRAGLKFIAVTDHNTVYNLERAMQNSGGIKVIPGIEFTAATNFGSHYRKDHILGLGLQSFKDIDNFVVQNLFHDRYTNFMKTRHNFVVNYAGNYQEFSSRIKNKFPLFELKPVPEIWKVPGSYELYGEGMEEDKFKEKFSHVPPQIIVFKKYIHENILAFPGRVQEVYGDLWSKKIEEEVMPEVFIRGTRPTHQEIISLIKAVEGVPILAHPLEKSPAEGFDFGEFLLSLREMGLEGVELTDYTSPTKRSCVKEESRWLNNMISHLAKNLELLVSVGSDNHGKTGEMFSVFGADEEMAKPLLERLNLI